jgi:hypothetical protein
MVVGNNPEEITKKYDLNLKVEPYVKYKYLDAGKYKSISIKALEKVLSEADKISLPNSTKEVLKNRLVDLKKLPDFDYYRQLTEGLFYDENGNALSEENPNGKWKTCRLGKHFSLPLVLKNGTESYSAMAGDVDWEKMNNVNQEVYKAAWEIVVEGRKPIGEQEETIAKTMGDKTTYFSRFKDKDHYVKYSTAYWNFAYVDNKEWFDMSEINEMAWVEHFYDRFVTKLKPDDLVSIYECSVNEEN